MPYVFSFLLIFTSPLSADSNRVDVGMFSTTGLNNWQVERFSGITHYQLTTVDDRQVLTAKSQDSASGLYREIRVDIRKTPYLHWSWRIGNRLKNIDEHIKAGDDYPARVYVVVSGGLFFWRTRALNYVWSSMQESGSHWPNAYTDNAHMIAVRGKQDATGMWQSERRNVYQDFQRYFGESISHIDAVAIMTDTDDSGQQAQAWYGDIYFTGE